MTRFDSCRRAASIALVVACLVLVPAAATAMFTASQAPAALQVSTASMQAPSAVTGTFACTKPPGPNEMVSVTVTGFTDGGPAGSHFDYALLLGGVAKATGSTTAHTQTLSFTMPDDALNTTWTVTIRAGLHSWTSTPYTATVVCLKKSNNTGTL